MASLSAAWEFELPEVFGFFFFFKKKKNEQALSQTNNEENFWLDAAFISMSQFLLPTALSFLSLFEERVAETKDQQRRKRA